MKVVIGEAIARATRPQKVWLQASTATIYAHRLDAPNDELTGILGGDEPGAPETWRFSIGIPTAWEAALDAAVTPHTRKVAMRSAMVMTPDRGGVFDVLTTLARRGLGGNVGGGRQYVSWIHGEDFVRSLYWLAEHEELAGAVNISSPNPLPYSDFMREIRRALGVRVALPAPAWMVEVAAWFMRTESELVLKSRRVIPTRLLQSGFTLRYPRWSDADADRCARLRPVPAGA